jgi:hypothetical protein
MTHIATFNNRELGIQAVVNLLPSGKYSMQVRDVEDDFVIGIYTTVLYPTREQAMAAALAAAAE